jgi:pentatricopeptide repeat protein
MGRKGGASAFSKVRPPTRKKLKSYHRRKRKLYHEKVGKHSKPGAKAGIRREYAAKEWQYLLDKAQGEIPDVTPEDVEYDFGNALLDDLIGNSSHLSSSPTPRPVNLGYKHKKQYSLVSQKMAAYLEYQNNSSPDADEKNKPVIVPSLPTDKEISMLLRSFRDKKSTKSRPLGIAKALKLLVQTAKVPSSLFGENTYTTLMTCAASPKEARRIMKLMKDNSHPISAYSYSILVDVYSRGGDFRGADEVISEMRFENIEPTLAAYTSLLKGCYKAIIKGAIPQSIKAEAGVLAWDRWREMRITGIEADVSFLIVLST